MIHGVRCIIKKQDRFLLCQHNQTPKHPGDVREPDKIGKWSFPGGHLAPHEDPVQAVRRELQEEFGITDIKEALFVSDIQYKDKTYAIYSVDTDSEIKEFDRDEIDAIQWFTVENMERLEKEGKLHTGFELQMVLCLTDHEDIKSKEGNAKI